MFKKERKWDKITNWRQSGNKPIHHLLWRLSVEPVFFWFWWNVVYFAHFSLIFQLKWDWDLELCLNWYPLGVTPISYNSFFQIYQQISNDIQFVLRYCINYMYFTLRGTFWGHLWASKTNYMFNFNNFSNTRPILDLKMSFNRHKLTSISLCGQPDLLPFHISIIHKSD